jgi:radical SAM protein with 4Fe4S-binding SPASM domain
MVKALTSPRHFLNAVLVMLSYKFRSVATYGRPIVVDLEPSNSCNFRCSHCEITYKDRERKNLSKGQYDVIMSNFPYALRVKLQGEGEPFLNDLLYDLIEDTCLKGVWCEVVTNGSILNMEQLKPLERFKNFQLVFSFDAADKTTFEKIRAGSNFEKILGNIDDVTQNTTIAVAAWMLLQRDNNDQVEDVIRLLAKKKVKSLGIQRLFFDFDKKAEMRSLKINGKWIQQNLNKSSYSALRKLAKRYGMQLSISDRLYSRDHLCPWPWMGVFIDTSGNVVPCCKIGDASIYNIGNLNEDDIEIIWNSKEYKDFRRRHKINDLPGFCRGCYSADS